VIQTTFSTPGVKAPETEITDDELLETLKKLLDERTSLMGKIRDLENEVKEAASSTDALKDEGEKLRESLQTSLVSYCSCFLG
jgi:chromosome segregation ATPase